MVVLECPIEGCIYTTADVEAVGAAALLSVHGSVHSQAAASPSSTKSPERPELSEESSDSDWSLFKFEWQRYKRATNISNESRVRDELLNCCKPALRSRLYQMVGEQLSTLSEQALLEQIQAVAVLTVHKVVHRVEFSKIRQDEGESKAHFVSRLKAKASLCAFNVVAKAPGNVSYENDMVEDQMMSGLYSDEHRARVLTEADKLPMSKDKYNALVTMTTRISLDRKSPSVRNHARHVAETSPAGSL